MVKRVRDTDSDRRKSILQSQIERGAAALATAANAALKLDYSKAIRRAELGRSRTVPQGQNLAVGSLAVRSWPLGFAVRKLKFSVLGLGSLDF